MSSTSSVKRAAVYDKVGKVLFLVCAVISVLAAAVICIFIFAKSLPTVFEIGIFKFLFGSTWRPSNGQYGILPMIVGSIYATVGALLIGGTLGLFSAIFLSKFCPKKLAKVLTQLVNLLAGIPSVVFGFFGLAVVTRFFQDVVGLPSGEGLATVSIILGIMILPTVVSIAKDSLDAVPQSYYEGALALGASKYRAVFSVVVPAAKNGMFTAIILGLGRALGETMAVVMIAGNSAAVPDSLFAPFRTLTSNIVFELMADNSSEFLKNALIGNGAVLFVFVLIINFALNTVKNRGKKDKAGIFSRLFSKRKPVLVPALDAEKTVAVPAVMSDSVSISGSGAYKRAGESSGVSTLATKKSNSSAVYSVGKSVGSKVLYGVSIAAIALSVAVLLLILGYILIKGIPYITMELLFGKFTYGGPVTLLPAIIGSLLILVLTLALSVPIGIFTAIFLTEYTKKDSKFVKLIRVAVETLAGVPSILFGIFGLIFFVQFLNFGNTLLSASLTLTLMILPVIIRSTEESLKNVPEGLREGSFALGAGKLKTIFCVILPSALPGIITSIILAMGRIMGESAPILLTSGKPATVPLGYGSMGGNLAVMIYKLASEGLHPNETAAASAVLIFVILALNLTATLIAATIERKLAGTTKSLKTASGKDKDKVQKIAPAIKPSVSRPSASVVCITRQGTVRRPTDSGIKPIVGCSLERVGVCSAIKNIEPEKDNTSIMCPKKVTAVPALLFKKKKS